MIQLTSPRYQSRIIDKWHFSDDWIGSPQDRCRYPSFRSLCYFGAGLDTDRAASLFGVDADTIASWGAADQAPPQVWRTLLALAGEFEAVNAAWKGWRIHKGKLHAPDLADGFTPGQIRALPFLHGALDAYRRQVATGRPDTSTVQEPKASVPRPPSLARSGMKRPDASAPILFELGLAQTGTPRPSAKDAGQQPPQQVRSDGAGKTLAAGQGSGGLGRPQTLARSLWETPHDQGTPTVQRARTGPMNDQDPALTWNDAKVTSECCQGEEKDLHFQQCPSCWDYRQAPRAGEEEGEARRPGAPALPESLPVSDAGRKRPTGKPQEHRQGRIIDKWHFSDDWIGSPQDRSRYASFRSLCYFGAGLDTDRAASLFGVDADTIASWGAADQAPPQVWRTLLALAGEFEAVNAAWKGWRIHKGKLHAPDLADGFTPGQIRALPFLHGALDAYRRQVATGRPDTSTVQEPKASTPRPPSLARSGMKRPDTSTVHELERRSPLGRDAGLGKPSILPAAYADSARSRHPDRPTDRSDPTDRSGPRLDVNQALLFLPNRKEKELHNQQCPGCWDYRQAPRAGEEEGEARRPGAPALPESLPVSDAGRKRPTGKPKEHRQGRIIDIMLNNVFLPISQSSIDPPIFSLQEEFQYASRVDTL